jgi:predicted oxidoreductase
VGPLPRAVSVWRKPQPGLWIESLRTRRRQKVQDIPDTLRAAWFPDSAQFWVEDHSASDRTQAYIYTAATLARLDLRQAVLKYDPSINALDQGHRYYKVARAEPQSLLIDFTGHTDVAPVACFDVRYRVTRAGAVSRLSRSVQPCW